MNQQSGDMKFYFWGLFFFLLILTAGCKNEKGSARSEGKDDCSLYKKNLERLQFRMIESERNADRLEEVLYQLTENYIVIDQKIRLIQKYKSDGSQEKLLRRTAAEINLFFASSQALLDSTEVVIQLSAIPQSSLLPIIENIRNYLMYQERLFIEVYGSLQSIKKQVSKLQKNLVTKEKVIKEKENDIKVQINKKETEARKIFYLVGSKSDLERAKAIKRKGGFLGLGATSQLSDKLETMFFQTADYSIMKDIALGNTKKANLITTHPKGSFLIFETPGEKFLKVTNPEKFWSTSKFLVVEVD
jgi:hypothetical protein